MHIALKKQKQFCSDSVQIVISSINLKLKKITDGLAIIIFECARVEDCTKDYDLTLLNK